LISLAVAMGIGRFVYTPILPDMIEAIGLTPTEAGLIATANFLGYLIGALAASATWLPPFVVPGRSFRQWDHHGGHGAHRGFRHSDADPAAGRSG